MARYQHIDTQPKFLPVDLARQLLPGTFEHAVHHLVEHEIDLTPFDARFRNDATGAPAYPPGLLLKVVLAAYAHGVVSSRGIERLCREHVTFIALCGDQPPHFTTIAEFVSTSGEAIARVFAAVVAPSAPRRATRRTLSTGCAPCPGSARSSRWSSSTRSTTAPSSPDPRSWPRTPGWSSAPKSPPARSGGTGHEDRQRALEVGLQETFLSH
jgi:hypothetical protein